METKFKVPLTLSSLEILKRRSKKFTNFFRGIKKTKLGSYLKNIDVKISTAEYLGICFRTFMFSFLILLVIFTTFLFLLKVDIFYLYGFFLALAFSGFVFLRQFNYPKMFLFRKTRDIERNLIPALQDILVQLESGVPIYQILINVSNSDYGNVSLEFKKAVKEIGSGVSQVQALENLIKKSDSNYFKRVLWQISNGMRSGSDMTIVIEDSIDNLNKEQAIQIQSYGNKLNPLIMFYMLTAVILPSLGIAFLIILSSMLGLSAQLVRLVFVGVFVIIILVQITFLGMIKTRRPSLL